MTDSSGNMSMAGVMAGFLVSITVASIALPVYAGVRQAIKRNISFSEYFGNLLTWQTALVSMGIGAMFGVAIQIVAKKVSKRLLSVLGIVLSIYGLIQSWNLKQEIDAGNIARENIGKFLAVMTAVVILSVIMMNTSKHLAKVREKARGVYEYQRNHNGALPKYYKGGKTFRNEGSGQKLPTKTSNNTLIAYKEYDVNPKIPGVDRGTERMVIGSEGNVYYTRNHYRTFYKLNL